MGVSTPGTRRGDHATRRSHHLPIWPPRPSHEAVQDPDQDDHQRRHLFGGQRPGGPIGAELDPERPRPLHQRGQQELDRRRLQNPGQQHHQQLPQAPQDQQGQQQPPQQHVHRRPGAERCQPPTANQTGTSNPSATRPRVVDHRDRHARPLALGEDTPTAPPSHGATSSPPRGWNYAESVSAGRGTPRRGERRIPEGELTPRRRPGLAVRRHVHDASQPGRRTAAQRRCTCTRRGKLHPCGSSARSPATRRRPFAVDPAFQRTAASTDRSAWHPPEPIARPQSTTSSDAQAEQVRFRFRMGAPTRRGCD